MISDNRNCAAFCVPEKWRMELAHIKLGLTKPGKTKTGLAKALGIPNSAVTELLKGNRKIKTEEAEKIASYLDLDDVRIMGRIGAGAAIDPDIEQVPEGGLDLVKVPFPLPDEMIAFEVAGDSMMPRYEDGDVIVVWRDQKRPLEAFYGEEAAVLTADGHRYLKRIERGKSASVVDLLSFNAKPIKNVKLKWIGEVYIAVRAAQLARLRRKTNGGS